MKKYVQAFLICDILLCVFQLINAILYCIIGNPICSAINGFASGVAFMGAIVMYDQYKNYKE